MWEKRASYDSCNYSYINTKLKEEDIDALQSEVDRINRILRKAYEDLDMTCKDCHSYSNIVSQIEFDDNVKAYILEESEKIGIILRKEG